MFGLLLFTNCAMAARLSPPLAALRKAPNIAVIATIEAIRAQPPALILKVERTLFGQPRPSATVLVEAALLARVEVGGRYALVYAGQDLDQLKPGRISDRQEGTLILTDGAAPALFRDVDLLLPLLDKAHEAVERDPSYHRQVIAGLGLPDPFIRDLWSAELVLTKGMTAELNGKDLAQVLAELRDETALPSSRARLLSEVSQGRIKLANAALVSVINQILASVPNLVIDDVFNPEQLAQVALAHAQLHPQGIDLKGLRRWLRSPRPALAELAALAIRAQAPTREEAEINAALAENLLPAATRSFLHDHLRRLTLMRQAGG